MERFNLQKIRELLSFNSLYDKNTEYMDEANSLPQIELETEPLYKLNTDTKILFTTKLRYYALRVEYEVNRYLNMVADFLKEHDDDQELTKEIIKATREEVITLIDSVKTQIYRNVKLPNFKWCKKIVVNKTDIGLIFKRWYYG